MRCRLVGNWSSAGPQYVKSGFDLQSSEESLSHVRWGSALFLQGGRGDPFFSRTVFACAELPQLQRRSTVRLKESYLIFRDCVWRIANGRSLRLDYCRLSKTECRDRSEDFSLNRIGHTDRDPAAILQLSPVSESIDYAEDRQLARTISFRPTSAKT